MSTTTSITDVTNDTLTYAPLALSAITSVEAAASGLPGATKSQIAVNVIMAAAQVGTAVPIPTVQAISGLVELLVAILNASNIFKHAPKAIAPPAPASNIGLANIAAGIQQNNAAVNAAQLPA